MMSSAFPAIADPSTHEASTGAVDSGQELPKLVAMLGARLFI